MDTLKQNHSLNVISLVRLNEQTMMKSYSNNNLYGVEYCKNWMILTGHEQFEKSFYYTKSTFEQVKLNTVNWRVVQKDA